MAVGLLEALEEYERRERRRRRVRQVLNIRLMGPRGKEFEEILEGLKEIASRFCERVSVSKEYGVREKPHWVRRYIRGYATVTG